MAHMIPSAQSIGQVFKEKKVNSVLLVCGESFLKQPLYKTICDIVSEKGAELTRFSDFAPNPVYASVVKGVQVFLAHHSDFIIAAGGGSAMDVAKCIKLFWNMDQEKNYLRQDIVENTTPLLAIPTTAGTGSEATRFAVIYYEGNKQSVSHASCVPEYVLLDASLLETLPLYQRKATLLDALCHGIESYWSVNAAEESKEYATEAIQGVFLYEKKYLANEKEGNEGMLLAAHRAGQAINLTQTTAGHAMCYKLTSLYGLAHGHAAALCVEALWKYMAEHTQDCVDARGETYLKETLQGLAQVMGCRSVKESVLKYKEFLYGLALHRPVLREEKELEILKKSVNPERLKNHPVRLTENALEGLYRIITGAKDES